MGRVLGLVVFPREVRLGIGSLRSFLIVCLFAVEFFGYLLDAGEHALERFVYLLGFFGTALLKAQLQHVRCCPEHAEGCVAALVGCIHRADGIIGLLYLALLAQVEYLFDRWSSMLTLGITDASIVLRSLNRILNCHMISMESKYNKRNLTLSQDFDGIEI